MSIFKEKTLIKYKKDCRRTWRRIRYQWRDFRKYGMKPRENIYKETSSFITDKMLSSDEE